MTGSVSRSQAFTASGIFTVPAGITGVRVTAIGAGGGGAGLRDDTNAVGRGGGGSGEFCQKLPVNVTPGDMIAVTIGAGGDGGIGSIGAPSCDGVDGGDTTFAHITCKGGKGAPATSSVVLGGDGGGVGGHVSNSAVDNAGNPTYELGGFMGGGSGARVNGAAAYLPSPCINYQGLTPVTGARPSGDGAPSPWGHGGRGVPTADNGGDATATSYGAGGAGCGGTGSPVAPFYNGGRGCDGYVLVEWNG